MTQLSLVSDDVTVATTTADHPRHVPPRQAAPACVRATPDVEPAEQAAKLRIGILGLGRQALREHIPALRRCDSAAPVAVCDEHPQVLHEQQDQLSVLRYVDVGAMFEREQLDVVCVAVPHHAGRTVIEAAADHGVLMPASQTSQTTPATAKGLGG